MNVKNLFLDASNDKKCYLCSLKFCSPYTALYYVNIEVNFSKTSKTEISREKDCDSDDTENIIVFILVSYSVSKLIGGFSHLSKG